MVRLSCSVSGGRNTSAAAWAGASPALRTVSSSNAAAADSQRFYATSSPSGALAGSPDQREPGTTSKIAGKSLRRLGAAAPELREVHTAGQARAYAHPRCVPPSL